MRSNNSTLAIDFLYSKKLQQIVIEYNKQNPLSKTNGKDLIARCIDYMYKNGVDFLNQDISCEEVWKDIIGYKGKYQISNFGRVKRLEQFIEFKSKKRRIGELILTTQRNVYGEDYVILNDGVSFTINILLKNHF